MAVRIRMKKFGRRHRPFFRICAVDSRAPRDGKVIEELGYYDPMIRDVDARAVLKGERIDYWLGVGAQPSEKVRAMCDDPSCSLVAAVKACREETGLGLAEAKAIVESLKSSRRRSGNTQTP